MGMFVGFPLALATAMCMLIMAASAGNLTDGFTEVQLSKDDIFIHWPYDVPIHDRYTFVNGVHKMRVFAKDKPFTPGSPTRSRTEIRVMNHNYSSGVWQFEGTACVPSGTSGVSIVQVFGTSNPPRCNVTLQLRIYDGDLWYFNFNRLLPNVYNRWLKINLIHDIGAQKVDVYIDGKKLFQAKDGGGSHYFKYGVYTQINASDYMESNWKDVRILKKE